MKEQFRGAFCELESLGLKKAWVPGDGYVFRVSRSLDGQWFPCVKNGYHYEPEREFLPLAKMPCLKLTLLEMEKRDPSLRMAGGRIFLSPTRIFRRNRRTAILSA